MQTEETFFQELIDSLSAEERDLLESPRSRFGWPVFGKSLPDIWSRFYDRFAGLRWSDKWDALDRLERAFAVWRESQGDLRGCYVRLHHELASLGPMTLPAVRPDVLMEDIFLRDILAHPVNPAPLLVFADWLEEQDDPRTRQVRILGEMKATAATLESSWVNGFRANCFRDVSTSVARDEERFSVALRITRMMATREAARFNHEYVGTQHLLLGMLCCASPPVLAFLSEMGLTEHRVRPVVERIAPANPDRVMGNPGRTKRTRVAIHWSILEAKAFGDDSITTHHLLLGLCRVHPCTATRVLGVLGIRPHAVCKRVVEHRGHDVLPWLHERPEVW